MYLINNFVQWISRLLHKDNYEIERKWILENDFGELKEKEKEGTYSIIIQKFLKVNPNEERRIRKRIRYLKGEKVNTEYYIQEKYGTGLKRKEFTQKICKTKFNTLFYQDFNIPIKKIRFDLKLRNCNIEVDKFCGVSSHMTPDLIEIEFDCIERAENFEPPSFFGEEVTNDSGYKNKNIFLKMNKEMK